MPEERVRTVLAPDPSHAVGAGRGDRGPRGVRVVQVLLRDQAFALEDSARELEPHPLRHVRSRGRDAAGRAVGVHPSHERPVHRKRPDARVLPAVQPGDVRRARERLLRRAALLHAERVEKARLQRFLPAPVGILLHEKPRDDEQIVHIGEFRPETRYGPDEAQRPENVRAVESQQGEEVRGVGGHSAPLRHEVEDAELPRHPRIEHREIRQMLRHRVGPRDLLSVGEHGDERRREGLGNGADLKERVFVRRLRRAQLSDAEAFGEKHPVAAHDGDRHSGNLPVLHGPDRVSLEFDEEFRQPFVRRRLEGVRSGRA